MKRIRTKFLSLSVLLLIVVASAPFNRAQTVAAVRVLTNPTGPIFEVDGTTYGGIFSAFWPMGSLHTLYAPSGQGYAYNVGQTIQWQFQGWQWSGGTISKNPVQVIADPSITQYTALYSEQYLFSLLISCNPSPCSSAPGAVAVNSGLVNASQTTWQGPGSTMNLQAFPNPGWTFAGWQAGPNQTITGFQDVAVLNTPLTVNAVFIPATMVNMVTIPPNLQVYADRTLVTAPTTLPWGQGSVHTVAGLDVQMDSTGKRWVFSSWSDGGAQSHTYTVANSAYPETITAVHAAAAYPYFLTSPNTGLNLIVDGQNLPAGYNYIWGVGTTHQISAPSPQTDSQGNTWVFQSWDDKVTAASRTITIPQDADVNGYRLTALFAQQAKLTIGSTVSGLAVSVDGTACATPCSVVRAMGTQVRVSAPGSVPQNAGSRQDFLGWSGGSGTPASGDWVAALTGPSTSIVASYHLMNQLTATANPAGGATWSILPSSADGFYDSQSSVTVGVTAQAGYRFSTWGGDLSGSTPNATLTMSAPRSVVAQFTRVPYITPNGVTNAAGVVPQTGVAPGSVASIFGVNLSNATAIGPATPMVQTLAGLTAHINSRPLPLYFASPSQINLQIPPDLALGAQTITVSSQGMPDVNTTFNIVRNAPGVFGLVLDGQDYALVLHEDGSLVTPEAPAKKGELLTIYGTGFGPTAPARLDGVVVPANPPYLLLDAVTVQVGSTVFTPQSSFAAPGEVGLDLCQFRMDSSAPSGATIALYVTVNGVNSNTLYLPIQ